MRELERHAAELPNVSTSGALDARRISLVGAGRLSTALAAARAVAGTAPLVRATVENWPAASPERALTGLTAVAGGAP